MKTTVFAPALATLLLAACSQPPASTAAAETDKPAEAMAMSAADHGKMEGPAMAASNDMAQATQSGTATGTINAIDATAGKITIAHGPVESLGWPAMTMAFAATPEQIASVKQGEKVEFAFQSNSAGATVISIKPMQ